MIEIKKGVGFLLFLTFWVLGNYACAQINKDSLLNQLNKWPNDNASIYKLYKLGVGYDNVDYYLLVEILKIAEKKFGLNKPDTLLGNIYEGLGNGYEREYNSLESMKYMLKLKDLGEQLGKNKFITSAYSGIANIYLNNNDYERAIENLKIALTYSKGDYAESTLYKAANLGNIGYNYYLLSQTINKNSPDYLSKYRAILRQAIYYHHLSFEMPGLKKDAYWKAKDAINLCLSYISLPNADSAQKYFRYTDSIIDNVKQLDVKCEHEFNKGKIAEFNKDYKAASFYYQASLAFAKKLNYQEYILENNRSLYRMAFSMGNYNEALQYFTDYSNHRDSVQTHKKLVEVMQLQSDYEVDKKNSELARKSTNNKLLIGLFSGLCIFTFIGYNYFKNSQKLSKQNEILQLQKITELEKDKQLLAVDTMLKGQEDERSRIAKDLHDGLGGMLSGLKMSLNNLQEKLKMTSENKNQFQNSVIQLDTTIAELRKISYNLMPEAIVKFGLKEAIFDLCTSAHQFSQININFQAFGIERELDSTANIYIYRIVQELINNAIKHAKPNRIIVQLTIEPSKILLTVEDDGLGIDPIKLKASKGIGISNINHRVQYYRGKIDFEKNNPHGTVVNIELNV